ncbi:MAG TPA: glycosyltransferase family 4 protein, partial [Anaerolineales bacterium]|nr:glycosyltransferase family 4 protein [Anaerolineales bacterium]
MKAGTARRVGILHYSAPPVIGGVESVIHTHTRLFLEYGYQPMVIAGRGEGSALPPGAEYAHVPSLDSQHLQILGLSQELERGRLPASFEETTVQMVEDLAPIIEPVDLLIVHNVFTKHFNLPLTAALVRLLDAGTIRRCVAWCHDITWTSANSRSKVHPGYPWDLLRMQRDDIHYVAVSQLRQNELAGLFQCLPDRIGVIYNGVDPRELLGLSEAGLALSDRLGLWESDINLLLPVRVTKAKNIELALRVTAELKKRDIHPRLVVTGPPDPHERTSVEYFQSLLSLREKLGVISEMRFVYESGTVPGEPLIVDMPLVAELFRLSDALFMPSHREGFGMPILEAGLAGIPVFCSDQIPAANEIGGQDVIRFSPGADPVQVAEAILKWTETSPVFHLRRRVR